MRAFQSRRWNHLFDGHDLATETPKFCVGEKVDFVASLNPPLPADAGQHRWPLAGNGSWSPGTVVGYENYGSVNYDVDSSLLKEWTTSCWFVNGPQAAALPVRFGSLLTFRSGSCDFVYALGDLHLYRPQIIDWTSQAAPVVSVSKDRNTPPGGMLMLQVGDGLDQSHEINFSCKIRTRYAGRGDITQLVRRQAASGSYKYGTSRTYMLDTVRFYLSQTDDPQSVMPLYSYNEKPQTWQLRNERTFNDSPGVPAYPNFVECYDSFVIYHVFRPDRQCTTENIYVTLGVDSWAWAGRAMYYSDQWDLLESESYVLQPNGPGNEDEFPVWEDIYGGN